MKTLRVSRRAKPASFVVGACALLAACSSSDDGGVAGRPGCDRACLEGFVDAYLDALVAGDPARLPLADNVVFAENDQRLELGQGTWRTITGLGNYRHYFADIAAGQAGLITVLEENGTKIIYDLRLAVADGKITEIRVTEGFKGKGKGKKKKNITD